MCFKIQFGVSDKYTRSVNRSGLLAPAFSVADKEAPFAGTSIQLAAARKVSGYKRLHLAREPRTKAKLM
jgi:hypothetical protein